MDASTKAKKLPLWERVSDLLKSFDNQQRSDGLTLAFAANLTDVLRLAAGCRSHMRKTLPTWEMHRDGAETTW
jgi:hypothetical protein